jgi:hypothetical protein
MRLTCGARSQSISSTHHLQQLGFKSCVRGTRLGLARSNRSDCSLAKQTLRRRQNAVPTQAFVLPPALIRLAQKVVFRGASGRLLLETAKKGGWRLAAPLTAVLFIYSVVATWFAAWQTKRAHKLAKLADYNENSPEEGASNTTALASASIDDGASSSSQAPTAAADACPICHGSGSITWDRFDVHEGALCPRCLGTGKKRTTFFGK